MKYYRALLWDTMIIRFLLSITLYVGTTVKHPFYLLDKPSVEQHCLYCSSQHSPTSGLSRPLDAASKPAGAVSSSKWESHISTTDS